MGGVHIISRVHRSGELGYWLAQSHCGRGIMTKGCRTLLSYAFGDLALNRVRMSVASGNQRSRAVAERCGFYEEGVLREHEWLYDRFVDHVTYGLLWRDWLERCGAGAA